MAKNIIPFTFACMKNGLPVVLVLLCFVACKGSDKKAAEGKHPQQEIVENLADKVKRNPDSAGYRMNLINALDSLKMYREAIGQTDSMIRKDSLNNQLWLTKAQLQEDNKDTAGAIRSYIRAANIYPSPEAQLDLANLYAETKNPTALLICANVKKMGQGRETNASCDFIAGVYYARTANKKQAIELFDIAINENYTLMEAYMEKGFIYYDNKNWQQALKVFETAINVNNLYADAWYWKAKCYEAMGNKNEAIANYQRSLGFDKELKEAKEAIKRLEG